MLILSCAMGLIFRDKTPELAFLVFYDMTSCISRKIVEIEMKFWYYRASHVQECRLWSHMGNVGPKKLR